MSHGAIRLEDTAMKLSEVFERAAMKPENDDMALPAGKSCADCTNFMRCVAFIGVRYINAEQHRCNWAPSRFRPRTALPEAIPAGREQRLEKDQELQDAPRRNAERAAYALGYQDGLADAAKEAEGLARIAEVHDDLNYAAGARDSAKAIRALAEGKPNE